LEKNALSLQEPQPWDECIERMHFSDGFPLFRSWRCRFMLRSCLPALGVFTLSTSPATAGIPEPDLIWYGRILTESAGVPVRLTAGTLTWRIEPAAGGAAWEVTTPLANINNQFSFMLRVPCESPEPGGAATAGIVVLTDPPVSHRRVTVTLDGQPLTLTASPSVFAPGRLDRGMEERIDLVLGALPPDSDGDGMTDAWELLHFGAAGADPLDDADGDGLNNLHEFRAGTDPGDARSRMEVMEVARLPEGFQLRWSSQPGKRYRIRRADTLLTRAEAYPVVQDGIAATPPFNSYFDTTAAGTARQFYLVEVVD
jgi:hypothetical protein